MASLEDDIRSNIAFDLFTLRKELIEKTNVVTPIQLIDETITRTVTVLGETFKFDTIGACESNGDPHYSDPAQIASYYFSVVNDDGGDV